MAKRSGARAKIKMAKRKQRLAKKELRLQLEWCTPSKAAYDTCLKANPLYPISGPPQICLPV